MGYYEGIINIIFPEQSNNFTNLSNLITGSSLERHAGDIRWKLTQVNENRQPTVD